MTTRALCLSEQAEPEDLDEALPGTPRAGRQVEHDVGQIDDDAVGSASVKTSAVTPLLMVSGKRGRSGIALETRSTDLDEARAARADTCSGPISDRMATTTACQEPVASRSPAQTVGNLMLR